MFQVFVVDMVYGTSYDFFCIDDSTTYCTSGTYTLKPYVTKFFGPITMQLMYKTTGMNLTYKLH